MSNHSITNNNSINELSTTPLDLRAPSFVKVKKGWWWLRIITLTSVDGILLCLAWSLAQYHALSVDPLWDKTVTYLPGLIFLQMGTLALYGMYDSGTRRYDYRGIIKTLQSF